MKKSILRFVSGALCACMIVGMLPAVSAEEIDEAVFTEENILYEETEETIPVYFEAEETITTQENENLLSEEVQVIPVDAAQEVVTRYSWEAMTDDAFRQFVEQQGFLAYTGDWEAIASLQVRAEQVQDSSLRATLCTILDNWLHPVEEAVGPETEGIETETEEAESIPEAEETPETEAAEPVAEEEKSIEEVTETVASTVPATEEFAEEETTETELPTETIVEEKAEATSEPATEEEELDTEETEAVTESDAEENTMERVTQETEPVTETVAAELIEEEAEQTEPATGPAVEVEELFEKATENESINEAIPEEEAAETEATTETQTEETVTVEVEVLTEDTEFTEAVGIPEEAELELQSDEIIIEVVEEAENTEETRDVTINDLNDSEMFFKQEVRGTCTLAANAMLVRRAARMNGYPYWSLITESELRPYAWIEGTGMCWSYSYAGINVGHEYFYSCTPEQVIALLEQHPEGFVAYNGDFPHAVLITDYTNGVFYCADPGLSNQRMRLDQAYLRLGSQEATIAGFTAYWYVTSPQLSLTPTRPFTEVPMELRLTDNEDGTITLKWNNSGAAGYWIYRSESPNGPWNEPVYEATGSSSTTWTDTDCSMLRTYYYCVRSFGANHQSGQISSPVSFTLDRNAPHLADGVCGTDLRWALYSDGMMLIAGKGAMNSYTAETDQPWYYVRGGIQEVYISNGVTSVGKNAFRGCTALTQVSIPGSAATVGEWAFAGCSNLAMVTLSGGVKTIGYAAFRQCNALQSITLPDTVTTVGDWAFSNCAVLTDVTLPSGLRAIGNSVFYEDAALTTVNIPATVATIGEHAFRSCTSLPNPVFPQGLTSIGQYAYTQCHAITQVDLGNCTGTVTLGEGAFYNCTGLTDVTLPTCKIGASVFAYCDYLSHVTISQRAAGTSLGDYAFRKCSKLTYITIDGPVVTSTANALKELNATILVSSSYYGNGYDRVDGTCIWHDCVKFGQEDTFFWYLDGSGLLTATGSGMLRGLYGWAYLKSFVNALRILPGIEGIADVAFLDVPLIRDIYMPEKAITIRDAALYGLTATVHYQDVDGSWQNIAGKNYGGAITWQTSQLATPVITSVANSVDGVTVKWNAVPGAAKYRVFYKTGSTSWKAAVNTTATNANVTGLTSGTKYTFTVRCLSSDGKKFTSSYDTVGKSILYIAAPQISSLAVATNGVTVKWNAVPGAVNYRVFYKTSGESWIGYGNTTANSVTVTGLKVGVTYTFTVRCISADGKSYTSSYNSSGKSCTYLKMLETPVIVSVSNGANGVTVKWNAVSGAEKYKVFYKTASGAWKTFVNTTATSATVTGLSSGTKYTFTVRCLSADEKVFTSGYDTVGKSITYLEMPVLTSVSNAVGGVTVQWKAVPGAANYRVFYKVGSGWKTLVNTQATTAKITGLTSGTKYTFTVRCLSADGKTYTSSYDSVGKSITYLEIPVLTSVSNAVGGVTVQWKAVPGAVNYRVFYKVDSGWKTLLNTKSTSALITGLTSGTKYTFTVRCLSADGKTYTSAYDATGKTLTYLAAPILRVAYSSGTSVTVTWDVVPGAAQYRVFYKAPGGGWKMAGNTSENIFTVTGLTKNMTYSFTVRCVSADGKSFTSAYDPVGLLAQTF